MTVLVLPVLLTLTVVAGATLAPRLLRHASPALARMPRFAVTLWTASVIGWVLAVLAVGPMLTWMMSGPAVLTGAAGEFCQRCLDLSNPLTGPILHTPVPALGFLALPALAGLALATSAIRAARRERAATRATARRLLADATADKLQGYHVWHVESRQRFAAAFPRRTGIVVSSGAVAALSPRELAAVLAHEQAHLHQHHHAIRTFLNALAVPLKWVPLVAAASDVVPHYLEISADDAARHRVGTTTLASALLKLGGAVPIFAQTNTSPGDTGSPASPTDASPTVLNATGPDRIRHLVAPAHPGASAGSASVSVLFLGTITLISAIVYLPYLRAFVTGCA